MALVSIVTATFKDLSGLAETRRSIEEAKGVSWEHIVVDGGSTDGTLDFLRRLPLESTTWVSGKDAGPYDAMNKGAAMARGRWIMFLNSGDRLADEHALARLVSRGAAEDAQVVYGDHCHKGRLRSARRLEELHELLLSGDVKGWLRGHPCHQSIIADARWVKDHPFDLSYRIAADFHWMERIRQKGARSAHVPGPTCIYLPGGLSSRYFLRCTVEWLRVARLAAGDSPAVRRHFAKSLAKHACRRRRGEIFAALRESLGFRGRDRHGQGA